MLSSLKKTLIFLAVLTTVAILGVWMYSLNRTFFNEDSEIGNTTGNIYNGGLFCEQDGKIYFSNDYDDGSLYVMNSDCTNIKKIESDKAVYINVDENYVYYVRANNTRENMTGSLLMFNNTGIYRVNHNGSNMKLISDAPGSYLTLSGNFLYFQHYDVSKGLFLYRNKIDATMERLLLEEAVYPIAVFNNSLYYNGFTKDHNINALDLSSFTTSTVNEGGFAYPIFFGNYIYYLNYEDNYKLYRMNSDGSDPTLLVDDRCSTYNITNSGKYLFYQVDAGDDSRICRLDLETMESKDLMKGNFKQIHVTTNYVFFKDYENTNTFILPADGSPDVSTFNPPQLK